MLRNLYSRLRERLIRTYRVEFIDDDTLSSSRQFQLKPLMVLLWSALLFIGIVVGTATFVILSPALHSLIPGYINPSYHQELQQTYEYRLDSLENVKDKYETYLATFRHLAGVGSDNIELISEEELEEELRKSQNNSGTKDADIDTTDPSAVQADAREGRSLQNTPTSRVSVPAVRTLRRPVLLQLFPPIKGKIRKTFSEDTRHYGTDIVAEENTPIRSIADGFVIISEYSDKNGWVIGVLSEDNIIAFYKHNSRLMKRAGEYVLAGEPLAIIGNTGENSTGPHLHLELWKNGRPLDPLYYINFN